MIRHLDLAVDTGGRGFTEVTADVCRAVDRAGLRNGLCHLFLAHTSASLCLTENADPEVRRDLERWAARLAPDGDPLFRHDDEGPDDMPAHARNLLAGYELTIPVRDGTLGLGTWQGIYVWEHRTGPHRRRITITLHGEG